jgi:hypothetical protein
LLREELRRADGPLRGRIHFIPDSSGRSDGRSLFIRIILVTTCHLIINTTLAGVAQSVERVALITAKRSTSRSWVRAPPSAIPISKLNRAAVLLLFGRLLSVCSLRVMSTVCSLFWLIRSGVRRQQIVTKPPKMHAIQMESQHAKPSSSLHSFVLDFTADLVHHHAYECHITTTAAPCLSRLQQAETSRR